MKINYPLLDSVFRGCNSTYRRAVEQHASNDNFFTGQNTSYDIIVQDGSIYVGGPKNVTGSNRLCVCYLKSSVKLQSEEFAPDALNLRIDIPTTFLRGDRKRLFTLYQIRFNVTTDYFDEQSSSVFRNGYVGITKRHFLTRFNEHKTKVVNRTGSLLHSAWAGLINCGASFHPVIQLAGFADDLDTIYAMEEDAVRMTKTPLGLNMIDGGYAGIQELHTLGLLNRTGKVPVDEYLSAVDKIEQKLSKSPHYRKGHIRTISDNRKTWVSPCWVNVKNAA